MLKLLIQSVVVIALVGIGLYDLRKTGVAKLGPFRADRKTNRAGFLVMMLIYVCASLLAVAALTRAAAIAFPD